jgi:3-hydroxybutyrate dehydrogenase
MTVTNTDFSNLQLNVKGRTAVVTGGGSGIGLTIVQALLHAGASVTAWDKTLSEPLQQLQQSNPDRLLALEVDVTDEQAIRQAAEKTAARHPVIDIVVNGAGIMYKEEIGKIDPKKWDLIYNIHAKGTMLVTQSLLPHLKQSKCGRIINIASMTARIGIETYMPYSSSKAAVVNISKVMAAELAPYGITVNAICPGWVNTPMTDLLYDRIATVHGIDREQAKKEILDFVPQKRMIPMEEIAFCVLFLASPLAQSISATEFVIDHGLTNNFKPGFHMVHNV